jgi:polyhydroxybutyrate depolymerase
MNKGILYWTIIFMAILIGGAPSCNTSNPNARTNKKVNLTIDGYSRYYLIHTPPEEFLNKEVPLLFVLHGGGGTATGIPKFTDGIFNDLADQDGFIVIYPNGIDKQWNDGRKIDTRASKENVDDVGFIQKIIEDVSTKYKVDDKRIFTCGISNGGFMSSRLACDLSHIFKGVGIVTAQISKEYASKCSPENPVSLIIMNGTEDPLVPYNGGDIKVFKKKRGEIISTDEFVNMWRDFNHCSSDMKVTNLPDLDLTDGCTIEKTSYSNCKDESKVELYKIIGGGHTWPGGKKYLTEGLVGKVCYDINGYKEMWNFFKSL